MKKIISLGILQMLLVPFCTIANTNQLHPAATSEILKQQLQEKERQLLAVEKELRYYSSEAPAITNTKLGLLGIAGAATVACLGILFCNDKETKDNLIKTGNLAGCGMLCVALAGGLADEVAQARASDLYEKISKEKQNLLLIIIGSK